jgi:hypothetical protein
LRWLVGHALHDRAGGGFQIEHKMAF